MGNILDGSLRESDKLNQYKEKLKEAYYRIIEVVCFYLLFVFISIF